MKSTLLLTALLAALFMSGCTIEKRTYRSGYHVTWKKNYPTGTPASEMRAKAEGRSLPLISGASPHTAGKAIVPEPHIGTQPAKGGEPSVAAGITDRYPAQLSSSPGEAQADISTVERKTASNPSASLQLSALTTPAAGGEIAAGIMICIFGLAPFGILIANGTDRAFWINLTCWLSTFLSLLLVFVNPTFIVLTVSIWIFCIIHGIVSIIRGY